MSFGIASSYGVPKGAVVSLPGGKTISLQELEKASGLEAGLAFENPHEFLSNPEKCIAEPAGRHFGWPLKNNKTAAKCRQGVYRVVRPEELVTECPYPIATQGGVGDGQVEWENHILVEISEDYYRRNYQEAAWQGVRQLAKRRSDEMQADAEKHGLPIKTHLDITTVTA